MIKTIVRLLLPDDAEAFRETRLAGIRECPYAFLPTSEEEEANDVAAFAETIRSGKVWGAFQDKQLVGVIGLYVREHQKIRHKGTVWGFYVRPEARSTGVADLLLQALIKEASQYLEKLQLHVEATNERARRLYDRYDFKVYGLERNALKLESRHYDEELRVKFLERAI